MCRVYQTMENDEYIDTSELTQYGINNYHKAEQHSVSYENLHSSYRYIILPQGVVETHGIYNSSGNPDSLRKMKDPSEWLPDTSIKRYDERFHEIENWLMSYSKLQHEVSSKLDNRVESTIPLSNEKTENNNASQSEETDSLNSEQMLGNDKYSADVENTHMNKNGTTKNETNDTVLIKNTGNVFYNMLLNQNVTSKVRDEIISETVSNLITNYDLSILYAFFEAMQKHFRIQLGIPSDSDEKHDESPKTKTAVTRNIEIANKSSQTNVHMESRHFRQNVSKRVNNYAYKITKSNYLRREHLCQTKEKDSTSKSLSNKLKKNTKPYISASEYSEDSETEQKPDSMKGNCYQTFNKRRELKTQQNKTQDKTAHLRKRNVNYYDVTETITVKKKECSKMSPSQSTETIETPLGVNINSGILNDDLNEVTNPHSNIISDESASSLNVTTQNKESLKSVSKTSQKHILDKVSEEKLFTSKKIIKTATTSLLNERKNKENLSNTVKKENVTLLNNTLQNKDNFSVNTKNESTSTESENKRKHNCMTYTMKTKASTAHILTEKNEVNENRGKEVKHVIPHETDDLGSNNQENLIISNKNMQSNETDFNVICEIVDEFSKFYKDKIKEGTSSDKTVNMDITSLKNTIFYKIMEAIKTDSNMTQVLVDDHLLYPNDSENQESHTLTTKSNLSKIIEHKSSIVPKKSEHSCSVQGTEDNNNSLKVISQPADMNCTSRTKTSEAIDSCTHNAGIQSSSDRLFVKHVTDSDKAEVTTFPSVNNEEELFTFINTVSTDNENMSCSSDNNNFKLERSVTEHSHSLDKNKEWSSKCATSSSKPNVNANEQQKCIQSSHKELKVNFKERAQLALLKRLLNGKIKTKKLLKERAEIELQERLNLFKINELKKNNVTNNIKNSKLNGSKLEQKDECVNRDSKCAEAITECSNQKESTRFNTCKTPALPEKVTTVITDNTDEEGNEQCEPNKTDIQLEKSVETVTNNDKQEGNTGFTPEITVSTRSLSSIDIIKTHKGIKKIPIISDSLVEETSIDNNVNEQEEILTTKSSNRLSEGSVDAHQGTYKRLLSALFVSLAILIYYFWTQHNVSFSENDIYGYLKLLSELNLSFS